MSWGLISAMGHVAIQTTHFDEPIADAIGVLGLRETERVNDVSYLTASDVHHELRRAGVSVRGVGGFVSNG